VSYTWTEHEGPRWTLGAAPERYTVARRSLDDYPMFIDGHEVDAASTAEQARDLLEARYEYEEHAADLETARLRLHQACERLTERYPRAAKDGPLASILEGLGDALGQGPEAAGEAAPDYAAADMFRRRIAPDLTVAYDASGTPVLEISGPAGHVIRRVTVSSVAALAEALQDGRNEALRCEAVAAEARLRGEAGRRRAEGKLEQGEAAEWLAGQAYDRGRAVRLVRRLRDREVNSVEGMTYDGTYWVLQPRQARP
jgi:hypothetical protein